MTDTYNAYAYFSKLHGCTHTCCWAHAVGHTFGLFLVYFLLRFFLSNSVFIHTFAATV